MRKIKVLEVNNIDLPGKIFNGYDFISLLSSEKFDIKQAVITKQSNNSNVIEIIPNEKLVSIYNKLISLENNLSIQNIFSITSPALLSLKEYKEADIIHFHMFHNTKLSIYSLIEMSRNKKVVLTLHDPWFLTGRCVHYYDCEKWLTGCKNCEHLNTLFPFQDDNCSLHWNLKKNILNNINIEVVVASKWMYDLVKKSSFFTNSRINLIPFGIDVKKYKTINKIESRKKLKIPEADIVLFLRAQNEFKGTNYVLQALEKMEQQKNITVLTCDTTGLLKKVEKKYNIIDLGYVKEEIILQAMSACDIFLMPSKAESFGMMAIEAMASGKPVIIFNNTSLPSITFAPECGYLVNNNDTEDLVKAISYLINNPQDRIKRGKLGEKLASTHYKQENYIQNIEKLYIKLYKEENNVDYFSFDNKLNSEIDFEKILNKKDFDINEDFENYVKNINLNKIDNIASTNYFNELLYKKISKNNSGFKYKIIYKIKKKLKQILKKIRS